MTKDLSNIMFGVDYAWSHYNTTTQNDTVPPTFVDNDLKQLTANFNAIRTYSIHKWYTPVVLQGALKYQVDVVLEIAWVHGATTANSQQINLFKYIVTKYPWMQAAVTFIFVGHENMPASVADSNELLTEVTDLQHWVNSNWTAINKPVVILNEQNSVWNGIDGTPGYNVLKNLPTGVPVFTNIYPYWADLTEKDGVDASNPQSFQSKWGRLLNNSNLGSRDVYIGETGWPSAGAGSTSSQNPTIDGKLADAVAYWAFMFDWVKKSSPSNFKGILCFEAYDEPFKSTTSNSFDNNWGIYTYDGVLKTGITLPFSRAITPSGVAGTPLNFVSITTAIDHVNVYLNGTGTPIVFSSTEWPASSAEGGYPFVPYGAKVEIVTSSGDKASATLTAGDGIGETAQLNLQWSNIDKGGITTANFSNSGVWS